ncbi:phosphopantetheine-binding protein [Mycobacterium sp. 1423905.2]|uniref:phosphopantetheine-binding protein n=1 Tax=Mycobacterium sp. 1423905.2 TaxID=1856859 RepID=UPI0007FC12CE|nr:phosphopantetheine-binding protein [Mycobacterium sp. 1423905.2]OBJ58538.1 hypothetical protein A9W95_11630 [Mycobacterium sp. 1423905.2]
MTRFVHVPDHAELESDHRDHVLAVAPLPSPEQQVTEPLTLDRVIDEITVAVRALSTSFAERELNGDTNLALDLGLESSSRVELLLDVQRALGVALNVGMVLMFAELTIAQLAELIVTFPEESMDQ